MPTHAGCHLHCKSDRHAPPETLSAVAVNENVGYKTRNESQIEVDIRQ